MYSLTRLALIAQSRSQTAGCLIHVKLPLLLSNQSEFFSSTSTSFMKRKWKEKSSTAKVYKANQNVRLIDSNDNFICEITYINARKRAFAENMKLFDMESDPECKVPVFKYVTGKELFELDMAAKKEMKETPEKVRMKIVRLTGDIMDHDVDFKMKNAVEGLKQGQSVKVCIRHKKETGPDERQMKESELLDKISQNYIKNIGKLTLSREKGILCHIYPDDSEQN